MGQKGHSINIAPEDMGSITPHALFVGLDADLPENNYPTYEFYPRNDVVYVHGMGEALALFLALSLSLARSLNLSLSH